MGYKRNPKIYKLTWDADTDYPGLEVQVRTLTMGQVLTMRAGKNDDDGKDGVQASVELLAERIVAWNLEDETGQPVPTTMDAILEEDDDLILDIINRWTDAVSAVRAPLQQSSPSGEPSLVASVPMEALSPSLAS
jgi:hypothetical protein